MRARYMSGHTANGARAIHTTNTQRYPGSGDVSEHRIQFGEPSAPKALGVVFFEFERTVLVQDPRDGGRMHLPHGHGYQGRTPAPPGTAS